MATGTTFGNGLLDWIFRASAAPTLGATLEVSLHTDDPGVDGSNEVGSSGSYQRAEVTRSTSAFGAASNKKTENSEAIAFPNSDESDGYSGDGSPVAVSHVGYWSNGVFLFGRPLTTPRTITAGQVNIRFAAGDLDPEVA